MRQSNGNGYILVVGVGSFVAGVAAAVVYWKKKQQYKHEMAKSHDIIRDIIAQRRSIFPKDYSSTRKVPQQCIQEMLEAANWAPTHGKTEPWRFIVFSGAALERLGRFDADLYKKLTPQAKFQQKKFDKKLTAKQQSSYVIAICLQRQQSKLIPEIEEIEAVACAVQNMHLIATSQGVGAYWGTGHTIESEEMKDFLGLTNKEDKCLGFFYVGYSDKKHPKGHRGDIAEKVRWINE